MYVCNECQRTIDPDRQGHLPGACPYCRTKLAMAEDDWVSVARVTNLAEAGFLANDLAGEGIESRVVESQSFSAIVGTWAAAYLIQVAPENVSPATDLIRIHLADDEPAEPESLMFDDGPVDLVVWRPVALMVLAGVASFLVGQRFADERAVRHEPPPRNSLPAAVDAIGRPFYTEPQLGEPRHRLHYRDRHRAWYLETDSDGDGRFEHRQRFDALGAGWSN